MREKHPLQPHVRASGLQQHRRITPHFSDWLWVLLWGVLVLASPPIPTQHPIRCGWAMGPVVPVSGSSAAVFCPSSGEGADAAWQGTDSLGDTAWHPAPALRGCRLFLQGHHRFGSKPEAAVQTLCSNVGVNQEQRF